MLYIYPDLSSSDITYVSRARQVNRPARSEEWPAPEFKENGESGGFVWSLPLRYSGLSVRRRLIRMMLALQKCGDAMGRDDSRNRYSFTPAADYARSVIDTAMLRGELRCRPSGEMARDYLAQAEALMKVMNGTHQHKSLLRKEVRRRTADFLRRYAAGAEA